MTENPDEIDRVGSVIDCRTTPSFALWLSQLPGSLVLTTYQAGKLALIGWRNQQPTLLMRQFEKPMGLAISGSQMVLATRNEVLILANAPLLAWDFLIEQPGHYDALYLPRVSYYTGDLNVHDVSFAGEDVWIVASRFSCLAGLSQKHCFEPRWKPSFISEIAPEDRCHLNGLAVADGRPKYVTALGESDVVGGWRENKATGGILIDVESSDVVLRGLSMPHSPRWFGQKVWLLNSGAGELMCYDPATCTTAVVAVVPAYLRGLCLIGGYAVVGMCQIREKHIFGGLPIQDRFKKLHSGIAVIELSSGQIVGMFEFTQGVSEIYDVQFLPGVRHAGLLNQHQDATKEAFPAPDFSYWLRPGNRIE